MVQVVESTRVSVAMGGMIDGPSTKVNSLFDRHVITVIGVEHTISVGGTGSNREHVSLEAGAIVVYVIELGSGLVPSRDHGSHGKSVSLIGVHGIGQEFRGGRYRDALAVSQFIQAALHSQISLPKGTIRRTSCHGSQQKGVDLNNLFHRLRGNVRTHSRPRIHTHNDTSLELERQRCRTLGKLHHLARIFSSRSRCKILSTKMRRVCDIGNFEPSRFTKDKTGRTHSSTSNSSMLLLLLSFAGTDIQDICADYR
mmetsp:Transcript_9745/g.17725  ORF Transcript_9745/g.17725 Transcript_9745/m.17725 type:complete len:255 (-) Transcript_9745:188-952(-)